MSRVFAMLNAWAVKYCILPLRFCCCDQNLGSIAELHDVCSHGRTKETKTAQQALGTFMSTSTRPIQSKYQTIQCINGRNALVYGDCVVLEVDVEISHRGPSVTGSCRIESSARSSYSSRSRRNLLPTWAGNTSAGSSS